MSKKILCLFLIVLSFICLTGCGIRNINKKNQNEDTSKIILVFVENDLSNTEVEVISKDIKKLNNITDVQIKSKEEVKNELMESSEVFKEVLGELENNPLSDVIIVTIKPKSNIKTIVNKIKKIDGVNSVKY